eukprot:gene5228-10468_t
MKRGAIGLVLWDFLFNKVGRFSWAFQSRPLSVQSTFKAPHWDKIFWDKETLLLREPSGTWPLDARKKKYVGGWNYWYRESGMRSSTDDTLVAYVASQIMNSRAERKQVEKYVELGCGIGSILFLIAHALSPRISVGIEAQEQSALLCQKSISELPKDAPHIEVWHGDLRKLIASSLTSSPSMTMDEQVSTLPVNNMQLDPTTSSNLNVDILIGSCDLVTANPPYSPLGSGALPKDPQKMSARFELRGGIEDYMGVARKLLTPDGRFVFVFWTKNGGDNRVRRAAAANGLTVRSHTKVFGGIKRYPEESDTTASTTSTTTDDDSMVPQMIIYETALQSQSSTGSESMSMGMTMGMTIFNGEESTFCVQETETETIRTLDIRVPAIQAGKGGYSDTYRDILRQLSMPKGDVGMNCRSPTCWTQKPTSGVVHAIRSDPKTEGTSSN